MTAAELEIGLHRHDTETYRVDLRFQQPEGDADVRPANEVGPLRLDHDALLRASDPTEYGRELARQLFTETGVAEALDRARVAAESQGAPLRVRLFIGPSAPELHNLRWETLLDPATMTPLLTNQNIVFSRYLSSLDWRPVRLRPQSDLTALVVVAAPTNIAKWKMADVKVEQELETARSGLGNIVSTEIAGSGTATLDNIVQHLRNGVDILYLIAHGVLHKGEPILYLEDSAGETTPVAGSDFVQRLRELPVRPRLIVLASCQSAGKGSGELSAQDGGALAGLGPQLAQAGVPAVLAMQGNISMETVRQFIPVFFTELRRDGQIDGAVAAARGRVRERSDWWMPVLFMRLKSGRIWYLPGFGNDQQALQQWPALLRAIDRRKCTPILGPGIAESILGSPSSIARHWAEAYTFPLESHQRDNLPQVAQFLAVNQGTFFLQDEFEAHLRREVWEHVGDLLDPGLEQAPLAELLAYAGTQLQSLSKPTIHQVLAQLDLPIYITTSPYNLLYDALSACGKEPIYEFCRWNDAGERLPLRYDEENDDPPTPERPLIYHLFGHLSVPDTMVLTEDDYFDFLIGVTSKKELIPSEVRRALADTALLFLGFGLADWDFRVLFRSIMQSEGGGRRRRYQHIAAQLNPEEERILEPAGARQYLEARFQDADINIFWGSVEDFRQALLEKLA